MKPSPASWCVAIGVTVAVHGGVLWSLTRSSGAELSPWVEPPAIELVSILGAEAGVDAAHDRPAPKPEKTSNPPTPPPPVVETSPAQPSPPTPPPTIAAADPAPSPADAVAAPSANSAAAHAHAAAEAPERRPAPRMRAGAASGLDVNAPHGKSQDYANMLRVWLEAHKTYPKHAKMRREEGVVRIRFAVDRRGQLLDGAIVKSSGVASLDREALAMLDRSNPFPAAPHTVRGERIELQTPVEFYLR